MSRMVIGSLGLDFSFGNSGQLEFLGPAISRFFVRCVAEAVVARVVLRPMDDSFSPAMWRDARVLQPWPSLRLLKTPSRSFAILFTQNSPTPMAAAVSDHLFSDNLLWFDPTLTRDNASQEKLTTCVFLCVIYPFLMHYVAGQGLGLLLHTSAVRIDGRMWLFAGRSGVGKSTFSRLWIGQEAGQIVNDDRALVRPDEKGTGFSAYSVPWIGEDRIMRNESAPLAGICFLHQSATSQVCPLTPQQALRQLFPVASIPWYEQALVGPALDVCDRLLSNVPAYELHFRPDQTAVDAALALAGR